MKRSEANPHPLVAISILNWMNYQDTIACIQSVMKLEFNNLIVLIRDNASPNDSFERLQEAFPENNIYRTESNEGFAAGHYANYKLAKGMEADLFWILNSDLEVDPNALTELVKAYNENPKGIYGSVSFIPGTADLVDFGGAELTALTTKQLTYNSWKGRSYEELKLQRGDLYEVESVEGSSMLIPMSVIEEFGFMKLDFFMYGEETDYCYRLRSKGIRSFVVTKSTVTHHNEGSTKLSPQLKAVPAYYRRRNALRFSMEHLGMQNFKAIAYGNGIFQNMKALLIGVLSRKKNLTYFYALGCFHAFFGVKRKRINPEDFL